MLKKELSIGPLFGASTSADTVIIKSDINKELALE